MQSPHTHKLSFRRFLMGTMTAVGFLMSKAYSSADANHDGVPSVPAAYMYGSFERLTFDQLIQKAHPTNEALGRDLTIDESVSKELHYISVEDIFNVRSVVTKQSVPGKFSPILNPELEKEYSRIGKAFLSTLHSLGLMKQLKGYNNVSLLTLLQLAHDSALKLNYFELSTQSHSDATDVVSAFRNNLQGTEYDLIETFLAEWISHVLGAINTSTEGNTPAQEDALLMLVSSPSRLADYEEALKNEAFQRWLAECERVRQLNVAALLSKKQEEKKARISSLRTSTTTKNYNYRR